MFHSRLKVYIKYYVLKGTDPSIGDGLRPQDNWSRLTKIYIKIKTIIFFTLLSFRAFYGFWIL